MLCPCTPLLAAALLCVVIISCQLFLPRCAGCTPSDRMALLDLQHEVSMYLPPDYWDWSSRDCCQWMEVSCDSRTGHVTALDLDAFPYPPTWPVWPLNATLFLPFKELQSLSLRYIGIQGCIPGAGFEVWSKLRNLKSLDLSGNELNDSSISSIVALSSIRSLFLNYTALSSALTIQQLSTMKLETLDLSHNAINGTISTGICNMNILQELHLNDNMLFGELPSCIGNLTSLRILDLSNNLLTVKFPSLSLENFRSLVKLSFSNNNLEGVLLLRSFSNNSQLTHLELASIGNDFQLRTEIPATDMSAQLQVLVLRNCNLNGNSAVLLSFLLHQHVLDFIDISNNNLSGHFPSWLIEKNVNLSYLILEIGFRPAL